MYVNYIIQMIPPSYLHVHVRPLPAERVRRHLHAGQAGADLG